MRSLYANCLIDMRREREGLSEVFHFKKKKFDLFFIVNMIFFLLAMKYAKIIRVRLVFHVSHNIIVQKHCIF